jgi:hypothetical protein
MVVIEMNPRVSRSSRAGLQGDRLPDRQDRRQAGGGLHAGRDPQRHHARDAGLLRADHRLRRDQDAALRLREVPRRRRHARHADEVGRRDDEHRQDLQAVVPEGAALAGNGRAGFGADGKDAPFEALADEALEAGCCGARMPARVFPCGPRSGAAGPWSGSRADADRPLVPAPHSRSWRPTRTRSARRLAGRAGGRPPLFRRPRNSAIPTGRSPSAQPTRMRAVRAARESIGLLPVYGWWTPARRSSRPYTPYFYSTYGEVNEEASLPTRARS